MGRGRQKAKQQKIARKLKYLTTDTDYDELAKELSVQEPGSGLVDPFADERDDDRDTDDRIAEGTAARDKGTDAKDADTKGMDARTETDQPGDGRKSGMRKGDGQLDDRESHADGDDLDDYARWAAQAAAKATTDGMPAPAKPARRRTPHIPMPKPSVFKQPSVFKKGK